ncbi:MAG: hypothetical protein WC858_05480 [Parcubacteria group bacterium]|jgi:hypothetical protein
MESLKKYGSLAKTSWIKNPLISSFFIFAFVFSAYGAFYLATPGVSALDDHLFLFKYSELIREQGREAINNFHWLPLSRFSSGDTAYSVSLFNFALIPFTYFKDKLFGLKLSDIFIASLSLGIFYYALRKLRIKFAFLLVLFLLSIYYFSSRLLMGRAVLLISSLVILEYYFAVNKKYKKLFVASFLHVLIHQATFFLPLLIAAAVEISRFISAKTVFWKNIWPPIFAAIIGMMFYPGFPGNLFGLSKTLINLHGSILSSGDMGLVEGMELARTKLTSAVEHSTLLLLMLLASFAVAVYYYLESKQRVGDEKNPAHTKLDLLHISSFLIAFAFFGGSLLLSGRFYDFYFTSAVLLFAITLQRLAADEKIKITTGAGKSLIAGTAIFLIVAAGNNFINIKRNVFRNDTNPWEKTSTWLKKQSSLNDLVFLQNWSHFPAAFFYNQQDNYTMGAEPKLLLDYNPQLFWEWFNIFRNNYYCGLPKNCFEEKQASLDSIRNDQNKKEEFEKKNSALIIKAIREDFRSKLVLSDSSSLNNLLEKNPDMIADRFESKSKITGITVRAYVLK